MVFFVCDGCGGSFKRKQADVHRTRCRNWAFSCMDCHKEFQGDSYAQHTQCITESEKYFGDHHVAKTGKDKNEIWLEKVKKHLATQKNLKPFTQRLVDRIVAYPNIPRKEAKFGNFLKVNLNMTYQPVVDELWRLVSGANDPSPEIKDNSSDKENTSQDKTDTKDNTTQAGDLAPQPEQQGKKKNKKRKLQEAEDGGDERVSVTEEESHKKKDKSKKQKSSDDEETSGKSAEDDDEEKEKKAPVMSKSQKRKLAKQRQLQSATEEPDMLLPSRLALATEPNQRDFADHEDISVETVVAKNNFKWRSTLKKLLKGGPAEGMKMSKLLNKVLQLHNDPLTGSDHQLPKETLQAILLKTLANKPFSVSNNRAKYGKFSKASQ